jgi:pilus assembly protein CpaB
MKPRTIILLFVAVVCGLAASYMTTKLLARREPAQPTKEIWVVRSQDGIKANTKIDKPEDLFERKRFLEAEMPKAGIEPKEDPDKSKGKDDPYWQLRNKYVNKYLAQGQFITEKDFLSREALLIPPPGHTCFAIKASAESTAGGFVLPNSRVDVIMAEDLDNGRKKTRTVMENVLVMAVDLVKNAPAGDKNAQNVASPNTVTLAVKPEDANRLTLWQDRQGKMLRLALRSPDDKALTESKGTDSALDPDAAVPAGQKGADVVNVIVAARDLEAGTVLQQDHWKIKRYRKDDVPPNAINDADQLKKLILQQPVGADEFFAELDFKPVKGTKSVGGKTVKPEAAKPVYEIEIIGGSSFRRETQRVTGPEPGKDGGK